MFHLKKLKNRFRLSVSEYNKIAEFLNNLCGGIGVQVQRPDTPSSSMPVEISIDPGSLGAAGTPADHTDDCSEPIVDGDIPTADQWTWTAGGANGLMIDVFCLVTKPSATNTRRYLRRCRLTIGRLGTIVKAEIQPEGTRMI